MTELTINQMKQINGGKMSGALLTGNVVIINACINSLTSLITNGFSIAFATQQKIEQKVVIKQEMTTISHYSDKHNNLNNANYEQILFV